eukprot:scaffold27069_cov65-Phaeocystis_antarctica.AAC.4
MGSSPADAKQLARNVQERIAADQYELGKLFTQLTTFTNQPCLASRLAPDTDKLAMTKVYERICADQRELGELLKRAAPETTKLGDAGVNSACMVTDFAIKFSLGKEAAGELMHLVWRKPRQRKIKTRSTRRTTATLQCLSLAACPRFCRKARRKGLQKDFTCNFL